MNTNSKIYVAGRPDKAEAIRGDLKSQACPEIRQVIGVEYIEENDEDYENLQAQEDEQALRGVEKGVNIVNGQHG